MNSTITGLSGILVDFIFHLDRLTLVSTFVMLPRAVVVGIKNEPRLIAKVPNWLIAYLTINQLPIRFTSLILLNVQTVI
ncbi:MAG: hypothetical protein A2136_07220 [Chloroflexi bacterium RBG_16_54_11]|nr:MAG: hypothetical protein A2136_07220 [Chloroflexi bacterium RBG_16_54_11]